MPERGIYDIILIMENFFGDKNFLQNENAENNNFFSSNNVFISKTEEEPLKDNSIESQYKNIELNYEQIFIEAAESIRRDLNEFKPKDACTNCTVKDCKIEVKDVFTKYPSGCKYREWQLQVITYLTGDYQQKLNAAYKSIMDKKKDYECNKCGACCRLAVSGYSYEQLKQRARKGDKYSEEFVSIFVPYKTEEEAKTADPEYFELLNTLVEDDKIYYYYCPKLEGNTCSIYENRPGICKDFPHNPLKLLPSKCSYNEWKNEVSHAAMLLKAKSDIIVFYKEKLG